MHDTGVLKGLKFLCMEVKVTMVQKSEQAAKRATPPGLT